MNSKFTNLIIKAIDTTHSINAKLSQLADTKPNKDKSEDILASKSIFDNNAGDRQEKLNVKRRKLLGLKS